MRPAGDQELCGDHLRAGAAPVGDPQGDAVIPAGRHHLAALGRVPRHRFLAEHVLSVLRGEAGVVAVGIGRGRDDDGLHLPVAHQFGGRIVSARAAEAGCEVPGGLQVAPADGNEFEPLRTPAGAGPNELSAMEPQPMIPNLTVFLPRGGGGPFWVSFPF